MKFISHRGNINMKNINKENSIHYINTALNIGYDVEVDVWYDNGFWLGHDQPMYKTDIYFLDNKKLWIHAKNFNALVQLQKYNLHYFWHQTDWYTLTSYGFIWTYPGYELFENSICVLPENHTCKPINCYGICSDFIERYKYEYSNII